MTVPSTHIYFINNNWHDDVMFILRVMTNKYFIKKIIVKWIKKIQRKINEVKRQHLRLWVYFLIKEFVLIKKKKIYKYNENFMLSDNTHTWIKNSLIYREKDIDNKNIHKKGFSYDITSALNIFT